MRWNKTRRPIREEGKTFLGKPGAGWSIKPEKEIFKIVLFEK